MNARIQLLRLLVDSLLDERVCLLHLRIRHRRKTHFLKSAHHFLFRLEGGSLAKSTVQSIHYLQNSGESEIRTGEQERITTFACTSLFIMRGMLSIVKEIDLKEEWQTNTTERRIGLAKTVHHTWVEKGIEHGMRKICGDHRHAALLWRSLHTLQLCVDVVQVSRIQIVQIQLHILLFVGLHNLALFVLVEQRMLLLRCQLVNVDFLGIHHAVSQFLLLLRKLFPHSLLHGHVSEVLHCGQEVLLICIQKTNGLDLIGSDEKCVAERSVCSYSKTGLSLEEGRF